ncbi:MAG TPA: sigma-70 family RNA polymerase sigma factor [Pyrinomonadaceae bacterium]|nr:sigma-70 family RNA polymerase sigma factor [Pyrinomonadaceae bacterium]
MQLEQVFKENQRFLWGLCYRMTGSAADSDDILQETFVRLLQKPPADTDEPLRPWLVRVAVNLSRDHLRRRRRQGYTGQWLPAPFETENNEDASAVLDFASGGDASGSANPSARYEMLESVSFAFLLALELLTPTQRAVLLLRDVFDFNVGETAEALRITEQNVKTTHHRARRVMREYEEKRLVPRKSLVEKTGRVVAQLVGFLTNRDTEAAARLLAANVVSISDGGGEFFAARVPVVGRERVALMLANLFKATAGFTSRSRGVELNGLFAVATEREDAPPGYAGKLATLFQLDDEGLIERIYFVMASRKLKALPASGAINAGERR